MLKEVFALSAILAMASLVHADELKQVVYVQPTAQYAAGSSAAAQAVNSACHWTTDVVASLVKESEKRVVAEPNLADIKGLKLILLANNSPEATPASKTSTRWLELSGQLMDQDKVLGEFSFRREMDSRSLQQCKYTKELSDDLASDIANWLKNPVAGIKIAPAMVALAADTVDDDVKNTCPWDTALPRYMAQESDGRVIRVSEDINAAQGKKLLLKVVSTRLIGGGAYTGGKWMQIEGKLIENQQEIGNFIALRHSFRAWTACGIVDRLAEEIGDDMLKWLKNPSMNAKLGDADESTTATP